MATQGNSILNKDSIECLQGLFREIVSEHTGDTVDRQRMEAVARLKEMESDISPEAIKGKIARLKGNKEKISNMEIPLVAIYGETALASLVGTFLTGSPIFACVASKQKENAANMITALTQRDQLRFGWVAELRQCLEDVIDYNICAAETLYTAKRVTSVKTELLPNQPTTANANPEVYAGNRIKHLDPFNLLYDKTCAPSEVQEHGTYAGYVERVNYIGLKEMYLQWENENIIRKNVAKVFKGERTGDSTALYFEPDISGVRGSVSTQPYWARFWGQEAKITPVDGAYEVTTLYVRLIPSEFKFPVSGKSGNPHQVKLIFVDGTLAYAAIMNTMVEYLPIAIGQMYPGSRDKKSFSERNENLQDFATAMMSGTLASMRRAVNDRALYDPLRIQKSHIEDTHESSKIPVNGNSYKDAIGNAYHQIPYDDRMSGTMQSLMQSMFGLADMSTGLNRSSQGTFMKGNKTRFEFDTIMSNSEARIQLGALSLENTFFRGIKAHLKTNYLLNATNEQVEVPNKDEAVEVQARIIREESPDYAMADGVMPATKLANTEILMQAAQIFGQNPMLAAEYDIAGMFVSIMSQQGLHNLKDYKRTPEQVQQYMAQMQGQNSGTPQGGENNEQSTV